MSSLLETSRDFYPRGMKRLQNAMFQGNTAFFFKKNRINSHNDPPFGCFWMAILKGTRNRSLVGG
jgi:hypothetical protein